MRTTLLDGLLAIHAARVARAMKRAGLVVLEIQEAGGELVVRCTP